MSRNQWVTVSMVAAVFVGIGILMGTDDGRSLGDQKTDDELAFEDTDAPSDSVEGKEDRPYASIETGDAGKGTETVVRTPLFRGETAGHANLRDLMVTITDERDLRSRFAALHELAALDGEDVELALAEIANDLTLPVRVRREALLLLSDKPGDVAHETFLSMLYSKEVDLRLAAAQGIGVLGRSDALTRLSGAFGGEKSAAVVRAIVQSMSRIGTPEVVNALLGYSRSEGLPPGISRGKILAALASVSNPKAVSALTSALSPSADVETRRAVVKALGRIADAGTFDVLLALVETDPDADTRCHAMQGLGLIGDARAIPALRAVTSSTTGVSERSYALTAIERIMSPTHR